MRHPRHRGRAGVGHLIDRRAFLAASAGLLAWPTAGLGALRRAALSEALSDALERSGFVYVSPLRSDGSESRCHGEVWYAWLDGNVVLITGSDRWKARALRRGLDRARIWVGDYGRWKGTFGGRNEAFRRGPDFLARAGVSRDTALLERMLAVFDRKYPEEIDDWRERMRKGFADGSRTLIRYRPDASART